jgi:hypothetical protein
MNKVLYLINVLGLTLIRPPVIKRKTAPSRGDCQEGDVDDLVELINGKNR